LLNYVLKDIRKIPGIARIILDAREAQKFIYNYHGSLAINRMHANKQLLKSADMRYTTYYIHLECHVLEVYATLQVTIFTVEWTSCEEPKSTREEIKTNDS
jgi:hypothetical protein